MLDEVQVNCPWCGENFTRVVDYSAGAQDYIEDCEVCCQPIHYIIEVDLNGKLSGVTTLRDND
jgi:hypothetical protein